MSTTDTALERRDTSHGAIESHTPTKSPMTYRASADIFETPEAYIVCADMPGASRDRIDIRLDNRTLTICAGVEPRYHAEAQRVQQEYGIGDFHRSFRVGENINPDEVTAEYTDGVLTVTLPKTENARARRIEVTGG